MNSCIKSRRRLSKVADIGFLMAEVLFGCCSSVLFGLPQVSIAWKPWSQSNVHSKFCLWWPNIWLWRLLVWRKMQWSIVPYFHLSVFSYCPEKPSAATCWQLLNALCTCNERHHGLAPTNVVPHAPACRSRMSSSKSTAISSDCSSA